jgi:choline dehydrogenase-like flavoprotein
MTRRIDASLLEEDLSLDGDVVVVGTGAGGGIAAEIFARAGLRVIMLEEGRHFTARDFSLEEREALPALYQEAGGRKTKDKGIIVLQGRAVGGGTVVNWTASFRTPNEVLEHWARAHGVVGASPAEMEPWFARIERQLNIAPWAFEPNANNAALANGLKRLGWHAEVIPRNVRDCKDSGLCGFGCPFDAKQSMLVTTIPAALDQGAALVSRARAERLAWSGDKVSHLEAVAIDRNGVRPTGRKLRIKARHYVLAAGGIGTPALMLRSKLPDPHGRLGKRTFLHPVAVSAAAMAERIEGYDGSPQSIYSDQFLAPLGGAVGYKLEVPPVFPMLVATAFRMHGPAHAEAMAAFNHLHLQIALLRDGFHAQSAGGKVELRDDGSPQLDYPMTDYLWDGVRRAYLSMAEAQFAAGAQWVLPVHSDARRAASWAEAKRDIPQLPMAILRAALFSAHVMGGAAMGDDPKTAVVGSTGRHHQIVNLSVMDGSLFPTSLGANPQLSIYAFSAKLASKLSSLLAPGPSRA